MDDNKVLVDKQTLTNVIENLKYFANNTPIKGFDSMDTLVGCVILLQNALANQPEKGE